MIILVLLLGAIVFLTLVQILMNHFKPLPKCQHNWSLDKSIYAKGLLPRLKGEMTAEELTNMTWSLRPRTTLIYQCSKCSEIKVLELTGSESEKSQATSSSDDPT